MSETGSVPALEAGQVAAVMTEVATGILLRKDKLISLDGRIQDCYFVFESLTTAAEVAERSVQEDPSIEWVIVDQNGDCLRMVRSMSQSSSGDSWLRRIISRLTLRR